RLTPGAGAYPQLAGVRLRIEGGQLQEARVGGAPIDPARTYRVAMTHFTATGGDGYPRLVDHPGYVNTGFVDADVLRGYITAKSPIRAEDVAPGDAVTRR
ncbi:MAG: 5'-nucleotidase C-terminal domain-containing protein, partial [Rubrivivax sp.]